MCRIAGFWDFRNPIAYDAKQVATVMRDSLKHGGPDSAGLFMDEEEHLGLGHRRLSILDLSESGHQPMFWKHWTLIFNGEIYNFDETRQELLKLGYTFQSGTDTEVILKAFEQWGLDMMKRFRGMFAFVLWDSKQKKLLVCRDRVGVKPMFWYWKDGLFMFASELKAFHEHPDFNKQLNPNAISLFLQQGYIQHPHCIFKHAHKLEAGTILELDAQQNFNFTTYWEVEKAYTQVRSSKKSEQELVEEVEQVLTDSFELRMVADVPVGAFLSGGIDSSLVTALLQKKKTRQLKTFTIGFHHEEYNEATHAKAIAAHLGTDHHELYCTEKDFETIIPKLPFLYDEPFGDSSAIPTYLVAKMAKEHVKVSLSADGGDEIFGGYTKYEVTQNFYPKIKRLPFIVRKMMAGVSGWVDPLWLERNSSKIPVLKRYKNVSNKFPKLRNALTAKDILSFFNTSSTYIDPKALGKLFPIYQNRYETAIEIDQERLISFLGMVDIDTYLEGDIMTKVDRATMHVALEGRDPFLDHHIIEYAMQLPDSLKINGHSTKYLLRQVLFKHVPREMIERPKQGFSIPIQQWLLGMLKGDLEAMQEDSKFCEAMQLQQSELKNIIQNFTQQKRYINPHFIWFLYTLHQWYKHWIE